VDSTPGTKRTRPPLRRIGLIGAVLGVALGIALIVAGVRAYQPADLPSASEAIRRLPGISAEILRAHTENPGCAKVYATDCSGPILFSPASGWKGKIKFSADYDSISRLWDGSRPKFTLDDSSYLRTVTVKTHHDAWDDEIVGGTGRNVSFTPWIVVELARRAEPGARKQEEREVTPRRTIDGSASVTFRYPFIVDEQGWFEGEGRYVNFSDSVERAVSFFPISAREADILNGTPEEGVGRAVLLGVIGLVAIAISALTAILLLLPEPDPRAREKEIEEYEAAQRRAKVEDKARRERHTLSLDRTDRPGPPRRPPSKPGPRPGPPRRPPRKPGR
jgi:hypothetical protein